MIRFFNLVNKFISNICFVLICRLQCTPVIKSFFCFDRQQSLKVQECLTSYNFLSKISYASLHVPWVPEVILACGRNFRCWPKADTSSAVGRSRAGHYKDLTETGNRARKVSGTRGTLHVARPARNTCISSFCRSFTCHSEYIYLIKLVYSQFPTMHGSLYFWAKKLHPFTSFRVIKI